jgi:hypothetical protein
MDNPDELARELEEASRIADDERPVIEMMNGPGRPSERRLRAVLWVGLAFATLMLTLTVAVIFFYGLDILTVTTLAILLMVAAAMVGALRYKGEDPMAQFDSGEIPARGRRRRG